MTKKIDLDHGEGRGKGDKSSGGEGKEAGKGIKREGMEGKREGGEGEGERGEGIPQMKILATALLISIVKL